MDWDADANVWDSDLQGVWGDDLVTIDLGAVPAGGTARVTLAAPTALAFVLTAPSEVRL